MAYVPDQDADDFFNDATNEVSGTGYTARGVALASKSLTYNAGSNELRFLFADPAWGPAATLSGIRVAVLSKVLGGASSADPLVAYTIFASDQAVSNGTFTVDVDPATVLKITASAT